MVSSKVALIPLFTWSDTLIGYSLIDSKDINLVSGQIWSLDAKGYARRGQGILLHRFLLELTPGDGQEGDHRNGNRLDNRRDNLRILAATAQAQNVSSRTGLRGTAQRPNGRWQAMVGKRYLGVYDTEEEAAAVTSAYREQKMPFSTEVRFQPLEAPVVTPIRRRRKLTFEQAQEIRCSELSHEATAKEYGVSPTLIGEIRRGKIYNE